MEAGERGQPIWRKLSSVDLRQRVVDAVASGMSCRAAAARLGVGAYGPGRLINPKVLVSRIIFTRIDQRHD